MVIKATQSKGRGGRKTQIPSVLNRLEEIKNWSSQGLHDNVIAANLGIGLSTLFKYKAEKSAIAQCIQEGRREFRLANISKLEDAAFKVACGYKTQEIKRIIDNSNNVIRTEILSKDIPPNATVLLSMLQNLMPDVYKDRRNIAITGANNGPVELSSTLNLEQLSKEELLYLEKIVKKASNDKTTAH